MAFVVDTGSNAPRTLSEGIEEEFGVTFITEVKAKKATREIISRIGKVETVAELEKYIIDESLMIDALFLFDNDLQQMIEDAYRARKRDLAPAKADPAVPGNILGLEF